MFQYLKLNIYFNTASTDKIVRLLLDITFEIDLLTLNLKLFTYDIICHAQIYADNNFSAQ
jgi:hypothetical protein